MAPEFTFSYMLICLIGLCLFFQNYLLILGTKLPINFGIIDTLAICIYLPVVSIMLYVLFGEHISIRKIIGIIFACISGYFVLT
jgi:drug/metabolite transporter (DMT)-like permease|tara:strand:- start:547 stop:798 length:252 start_codon:yes stop_codon:yes gene_type:complete